MGIHHLFIDLETFSDVDIGRAGLYRYAESPAFQILLLAYSFDGEPVQVIDMVETGGMVTDWLFARLTDSNTVKHAFNAQFEWVCLSRHFGLELPVDQWRCSMLHAMYCGYPASLASAGFALGIDRQKLSVGRSLITYFCKPCAPTRNNGGRTRNLPYHDPDKWELFKTYNARDVEAEMAIDRALARFPVPDDVQRQWVLDQQINARGVAVDRALVAGAVALCDRVHEDGLEEARRLTGLDNPNSVKQLTKWLETETAADIPDLRANTVNELLGRGLSSDAANRVLELRQELGKASVKKYAAIESCVCADNRVRGLLMFYGASRTGREAGRLVQVQNLPHDTIPEMDVARELTRRKDLAGLRLCYGSVTHALSALIRTAFVPAPGKCFIDADFSSIEARVLAWLAGENWALDVFRGHGRIYEATAAQMFHIDESRIKKGNPEYAYRAKGKIATLALGYQGGTGALIQMGALTSGLTEDELPDIVSRWRNANPSIQHFWYAVEEAAKNAVTKGAATNVGRVRFARESDGERDFMTIRLPSGRKLYYASPSMGVNRYGRPAICYWGAVKQWDKIETYGGRLVENITQAVARDCLFYAMENLEEAGYRIVFDVHDEVIIEAPAAQAGDLDEVIRIMSQPAPWADGLPLNADGWVGEYFQKG